MRSKEGVVLRKGLLNQKVVFMPSINDLVGELKSNIRVADQGKTVLILDKREQAVLVGYQGLSKWIHDTGVIYV